MSVELNFSLNEVDRNELGTGQGFEPIEPGTYILAIERTEMKKTSDWQNPGDNESLMIGWRVLEGPNTGRMVFDFLRIVNKDAQTVKNAKKDLARICLACGVEAIQNTAQLHQIPIKAVVKIREAANGYPAKNYTKFWEQHVARNDAPMPGQSMPQAAPQAPQAAAAVPQGNMPWKNQQAPKGAGTPFG